MEEMLKRCGIVGHKKVYYTTRDIIGVVYIPCSHVGSAGGLSKSLYAGFNGLDGESGERGTNVVYVMFTV